MANRLEELPLYDKVQEFWHAVSAILDRPGLRRDFDLRGQIESANDSIDANMKEGFEQPTDASFANFVFTAKGSVAEVMARTQEAHNKGHLTRRRSPSTQAREAATRQPPVSGLRIQISGSRSGIRD